MTHARATVRLREAIAPVPEKALAAATAQLSARYRDVAPAPDAILSSDALVAAYDAFRMPATAAGLVRVLSEIQSSMPPTWAPARHLDIGAGTGAAAWAAGEVFGPAERLLVGPSARSASAGRDGPRVPAG